MREGQQDMSFEIVDALINDQHFAIEAGVGIGKSFGYLVPVLLYSKRMNKPVIIATSTIALQEQLWRCLLYTSLHDALRNEAGSNGRVQAFPSGCAEYNFRV